MRVTRLKLIYILRSSSLKTKDLRESRDGHTLRLGFELVFGLVLVSEVGVDEDRSVRNLLFHPL